MEGVYTTVRMQEEYWPLVEDKVDPECDESYKDAVPDKTQSGLTIVNIIDWGASGGYMNKVTTVLDELQIPYDRSWEGSGGDHEAGTFHKRYSGSEPLVSQFVDVDQDKIQIDEVMKWLNDHSLPKVLSLLEKEKEKYQPPNNQQLEDCLIRRFSAEEATIIMKYKMENAK